MVLRKIFGLKTDKLTGEWGRPHKEELHGLHSLSVLSERSNHDELDGHGMW
jgi:hypothetical protein